MDHLSVFEHTLRFTTFSNLEARIKAIYLKLRLRQLEKKYIADLKAAVTDFKKAEITRRYSDEIQGLVKGLDILATLPLIKKADKLGIVVLPEWTRENNSESEAYHLYRQGFVYYLQLTPTGKSEIRKAVRQKQRENAEWWITKAIIPLITALTGIAGTLIAIIALLRK